MRLIKDQGRKVVAAKQLRLSSPMDFPNDERQSPPLANNTSVAQDFCLTAASSSAPATPQPSIAGPSCTCGQPSSDDSVRRPDDQSEAVGVAYKRKVISFAKHLRLSSPPPNEITPAQAPSVSSAMLDHDYLSTNVERPLQEQQLLGHHVSALQDVDFADPLDRESQLAQRYVTLSSQHASSSFAETVTVGASRSSVATIQVDSTHVPKSSVTRLSRENQALSVEHSASRDDAGSDNRAEWLCDELDAIVGIAHSTVQDVDHSVITGSWHGDTDDGSLSTDHFISRTPIETSLYSPVHSTAAAPLAPDSGVIAVHSATVRSSAETLNADVFGGSHLVDHRHSSSRDGSRANIVREWIDDDAALLTDNLDSSSPVFKIGKWIHHEDDTTSSTENSHFSPPLVEVEESLDHQDDTTLIPKDLPHSSPDIEEGSQTQSLSSPLENIVPTVTPGFSTGAKTDKVALADDLVLDLLKALIQVVKEQFPEQFTCPA